MAFHALRPRWTPTNLTALPGFGGGTLTEFAVDPYSPLYLGGGDEVNGWIATDQYVQRITDIFGTPTLGAATAFAHVGSGRALHMQFERGLPNWGMIAYTGGWGTDVYFTTDGDSWTHVQPDTDYDTYGRDWASGLALSPHIPGRAYISVLNATGSSESGAPDGSFMVTNDYGATWSPLAGVSPGKMRAGSIHVPFQASDMRIIFHGYRGSAAALNWRLYRTVLGGASVDISPVVGGVTYGVDNNRTNRQIATCDIDMNTLVAVLTDPGTGKTGVFLTRNALAASPTWRVIVPPAVSMPYRGVYIAGDNRNVFYLMGIDGSVALSSDGGNTFRSKQGNIATTGVMVGLCGG